MTKITRGQYIKPRRPERKMYHEKLPALDVARFVKIHFKRIKPLKNFLRKSAITHNKF